MAVIIEYIGHSCFKITDSSGFSVVIDPFEPPPGSPPLYIKANAVIISHNHPDHSNLSAVMGAATIISGAGKNTEGDMHIRGFLGDHGNLNGEWLGMITYNLIEVDGIRCLHLSDIGVIPDDKEIEKFGRVDILFIPTGGHFTIDSKTAKMIVEKINPKIAIPMHYAGARTDRHKFPLEEAKEFYEKFSSVRHIREREIKVSNESLPEKTEVWVLTPTF